MFFDGKKKFQFYRLGNELGDAGRLVAAGNSFLRNVKLISSDVQSVTIVRVQKKKIFYHEEPLSRRRTGKMTQESFVESKDVGLKLTCQRSQRSSFPPGLVPKRAVSQACSSGQRGMS